MGEFEKISKIYMYCITQGNMYFIDNVLLLYINNK